MLVVDVLFLFGFQHWRLRGFLGLIIHGVVRRAGAFIRLFSYPRTDSLIRVSARPLSKRKLGLVNLNGLLDVIDALINLDFTDSSQNNNFVSDFGVGIQNVDELVPFDAEELGVDDTLCFKRSLCVEEDSDLSKVAPAEHGFEGQIGKLRLRVPFDLQLEDHFAFD